MKKLISTILVILFGASMLVFGLVGCKSDNDLTPDQKITEIKRIYNGAYGAYFSKTQNAVNANLSPVTVSLDDYLEEYGEINIPGESKKVYDRMYAWYTIILQTVTELKGTEVLSKKYIIAEETDLVAKVSEKFADISSSDIDFDPVSYTAAITSLEICGVKDNTVFSRVTINTMSCNFKVYYNNSSDYGFIIQLNSGFESMVKYDNNNGVSKYIGIEQTDDGYYYLESGAKDINLSQDITAHVELIIEVENMLKTYLDNFNDNVSLFLEKQETVLRFD